MANSFRSRARRIKQRQHPKRSGGLHLGAGGKARKAERGQHKPAARARVALLTKPHRPKPWPPFGATRAIRRAKSGGQQRQVGPDCGARNQADPGETQDVAGAQRHDAAETGDGQYHSAQKHGPRPQPRGEPRPDRRAERGTQEEHEQERPFPARRAKAWPTKNTKSDDDTATGAAFTSAISRSRRATDRPRWCEWGSARRARWSAIRAASPTGRRAPRQRTQGQSRLRAIGDEGHQRGQNRGQADAGKCPALAPGRKPDMPPGSRLPDQCLAHRRRWSGS